MYETGCLKLLWGLREKIKDADAQLFVTQMERKKEANPGFFYDLLLMTKEN
jgi:hypothetical protein